MRLKSARIIGFQSYSDSNDIFFGDGINLIVGQNNAGKSALLRALLPNLDDDRHRSPNKFRTHQLPLPNVIFRIAISGHDLLDGILRSNQQQQIPIRFENLAKSREYFDEISEMPEIVITASHRSGQGFLPISYPSHGLFAYTDKAQHSIILNNRDGIIEFGGTNSSSSDTLPGLLQYLWEEDMFFFSAERYSVGLYNQGHATRLSSNASNLPAVLHTLSGERGEIFQKLIEHMREIFPTFGNLSVRPSPSHPSFNEIRIWPTEEMKHPDLSFSLNSSGTGVAQVMSILTAVMTTQNAVLIIDEINSFLHPAAIKSLLRILQAEYINNQYIISTHAPDVVSFGNPSTIHLVKRDGYNSRIESLDTSSVNTFREIAENVGVSMSDVFAADRIVWVEGQTEELCFPYLYSRAIGPLPKGTLVTAVTATGDFNRRRDREIVFEVYRKLSFASVGLVTSASFSFDTEKLTETERDKMVSESGGLINFLPRRHLECYLIDAGAIASFINFHDPEGNVTALQVSDKILDIGGDVQFSPADSWNDDLSEEDWLSKVDAAKLIAFICNSLSDNRVTFQKKDHTLWLMRYIFDNSPQKLETLILYLKKIIG